MQASVRFRFWCRVGIRMPEAGDVPVIRATYCVKPKLHSSTHLKLPMGSTEAVHSAALEPRCQTRNVPIYA